MTRYVNTVASPSYASVQAASAEEMRLSAVAALGAIPGGNTITDLTLSGASDGAFNLLIEYAAITTGLDPAALVTALRFTTGSTSAAVATALAAARAALVVANPADYRYDVQVVGASAGKVFMGMLVWAPPGSGDTGLPSNLSQAAWYVNAATGNDGNDGATALTALKTLTELYRRTQGRVFTVSATVTLSGDFSAEALMLDCAVAPGVHLTVQGTYTSSAPAAVDTFTAYNGATDTPAALDDGSGATDYSGDVGKFARITAGTAVGASAPVLKSVAAGVFRPGAFQLADYTNVDPDPADTFVIDTITTIVGSIHTDVRGNGGDAASWIPNLLLRDLDVSPVLETMQDNYFGPADANAVAVLLYRVKFSPGTAALCNITGTSVNVLCCLQDAANYMFITHSHFVSWGMSSLSDIEVDGGFLDVQDSQLLMQNAALYLYGGAHRSEQGFAFMDTAGGHTAALTVSRGAFLETGGASTTWGVSEASTYGIQVQSGSMFAYGVIPTVSGGTNDTIIGGVATAYAGIPVITAANNAGLVLNA